jgi:hypothetical protein
MKKGVLSAVLAVMLATGAFAFDLSVGGGCQGGSLWVISNFKDVADNTKPDSNGVFNDYTYGSEKVSITNTTDSVLLGFDFFADVTKYAEVDIGMVFNPVGRLSGPYAEGPAPGIRSTGIDTYLNVGVLGKYPFKIGDKFTLFPLLGVDYQLFLTASDGQGAFWGRNDEYKDKRDTEGEPNPEAILGYFDNLWIKVGVGGDFALSDRLFLRQELLWGACIREELLNKLTYYNDKVAAVPEAPGGGGADLEGFAHGLSYKLAVGYKIIAGK